MKFFTLFATLASVAYAQYCPITGGSCNKSNAPSSPRGGELTTQFLVDGFSCSGTIEVNNECQFTVKNFQVVAPGSKELKWYGAEYLNSDKGGNLLSNEPVAQLGGPTDITVDTDHNPFCRASLIEHVGAISLMDEQYRVICFADIGAASGASSSTGTGATGTGATGTGAGVAKINGTPVNSSNGSTGTSSNQSTKPVGKVNNSSDARSSYVIPSLLYVALLSLFLYIRN
ncbi:hypothetical protein H8356DRAFT_35133 [Neocallimastix lanati (nom. inval.)]|jgi:hypothetical protein|nr:hypothetical protein H8356DRAFT_35133 [Neocallimastix sp. JGI-2020a]